MTKSVKAVGAGGVLLALAGAALLLAGCGGGSSDSSSSTVATSTATAAGSSSAASGPDGGKPSGKDATGTGGSGASGEQPSSGGKHGPPVPVPKGKEAPKITPKERSEATVADMSLQGPSVPPSTGALSAEYTCDGKSTSPALRWQGVPQGTAELALFAMNTKPVEGQLFFDWAVAGLSPDLETIEAGKLPKGAVVGRNSFGKKDYEICPPKGAGETYLFTVFALPKGLSPAPGFEPLAFRKAVLGISGNVGLLPLSYIRG